MQCRDFREVADSYLSDELLVETITKCSSISKPAPSADAS